MKHTHSDRLERFLGTEKVNAMVHSMKHWYGPPIAVHGVPGAVYATKGGDFVGEIRGGQEMSAVDRAAESLARHRRQVNLASRGIMFRRQRGAFGSLSALIAAATGGKSQNFLFAKTGAAANAIGNSNDMWTRAGQPVAGAAGAAAPGGTATTNSTTGAMGFKNHSAGSTSRFVGGSATASVANTLLLIDQLLRVAKTMNSTATEAVTGTFSRYQSGTAGADDYAGGNFCFPSNPTTVLAATAHNWTVCQYTDEASNTGNSFPSIAGVSACVVGGIDLAVGGPSWFMPLASGDVGVKALTQMQCSAAVATGTIDFVVAHPIALFPCPIANLLCTVDGLQTAFNLQRIYDNACLSTLEITKTATTATNYSGQILAVTE
jgi:hypothetical protein